MYCVVAAVTLHLLGVCTQFVIVVHSYGDMCTVCVADAECGCSVQCELSCNATICILSV